MASSSSSSPSVPAFPSKSWKYHVFLSFRGEDTRKTFVDHLYTALVQKGIYAYKDDETLPRGESIGPSLVTAIEESQIAVIIFSKNYADSSWCLDELVHIMKCKDTKGQIVMPIFYDVDPSEVRKQKRKYGEAFLKHELENNKKVDSWRKTLVDASNISGWETEHIANGHESKCIQKIVDTISLRLHPITSSVDDNLVGVEVRMQHLISKLQIGLGGKSMIGIWGVGGGGKTTLASSVYDEISSKFDGYCFLKNIREESSNKNGLEKLQEKVLCGVLKQKKMKVGRVEEGRRMIKDRLRHRKVLIVLDDVDNLEHLEELAGSHDWFGEGSRIIITTRDEHVLNAHRVDVTHNITLLNDDESIKLLHKHARRDYRPMEDYEQLSKDVVTYAAGLPLALKVLGRFLSDKDMNEWRSALDRLKEIPDANILEVLKISFDGLKPVEKELFLDIACFFRWHLKDKGPMMILDACGFHPVVGLKVLIQKALITISEYGEFDMHDLVQEMGHYIVRGEHPKNPEKHSRVWKREDVLKICMDATTNLDKIEAIYVCLFWGEELQRVLQVAANMKKLRWIGLDCKSIMETSSPTIEPCSETTLRNLKLRQFWEDYKNRDRIEAITSWCCWSDKSRVLQVAANMTNQVFLKSLQSRVPLMVETTVPSNVVTAFPPRELCCLTFDNLHAKQLWAGYKYLPNLKMVNLLDLENLIETPDFEGLPNLERFMVDGAPLLEEIHPSFGRLEKLVSVAIQYCKNLKIVPPITRSMKLETVVLSNCRNLFKSSKTQQNMENSIPQNMDHIGLWFISRCLRKLNLSWCNLGDGDIRSAADWELPNLQELNLEGNKFSRLNFNLSRFHRLKWLDITDCYDLVELSELPSSIAVIVADCCTSLKTLGDISNYKWLWKVSLREVTRLGPFVGDILLESMLQGHAKDHFISITTSDIDVWRGFEPCLKWEKKFTMQLPHDWYNKYCGILMFVKSNNDYQYMNIIIKQGVDEDFQSELGQESNETEISFYRRVCVGYVSFSSMTNTASMNSTYNMVSFSLQCLDKSRFGAVLIPRKSSDDPMQTTDCSEFWDDRETFWIRHDSESSIEISWTPRKLDYHRSRAFNQLRSRPQPLGIRYYR